MCIVQIIGCIADLELHPDRKALFVVVLDLGFSQSSFFNRGPHYRLRTLIQRAVHQELLELFRNHALCVKIHRQIRFVPISVNAKALEFFTLHIHPVSSKLAALTAEFVDWNGIFVLALLAVLFFNLPLDRQTVAIPTRDVTGIKTHHLVGPHDHIFDRFIQRVTDVQIAVRIGWAIMQSKRLAPLFFA